MMTLLPDIDYFDTFAHITRISFIRVLIALVVIHKLVIHQMDVKTTFLNDDLEEEICMTQPEGCQVPSQENKVFKLLKSLYGLKCGSKASKLILMMAKTQVKNQDSSEFQESKSHLIKNQDSSEDSREGSRYARTLRKASR